MATQLQNSTTRNNVVPWPAHRPTEEVIAERMLAAALYNYHRVMAGQRGLVDSFKTWEDLTDGQRAFLVDWAIPHAVQTIWKGR